MGLEVLEVEPSIEQPGAPRRAIRVRPTGKTADQDLKTAGGLGNQLLGAPSTMLTLRSHVCDRIKR